MPRISSDELDTIDVSLRILDNLDRAGKALDEQFEDALDNAPDEETQIGGKYNDYCNLLGDIHKLIVDELIALRNGLTCQCDDEDEEIY